MSSKQEPQRRQTHEQLRLDHILALEELQRCKNEIERLKEQTKLNIDQPAAVVVQDDKKASLAEYVEKIKKQEKEIADIKAQMRKNSLEDQQRFNLVHTRTVEEFTVQLNKFQTREKEMASLLEALQKQVELIPALEGRILQQENHLSSSKRELDSMSSQLSAKDAEINRLANQCQTAQNALRELEKSYLALQTKSTAVKECNMCVSYSNCVKEKDSAIAALEQENDQLTNKVRQLEVQAQYLATEASISKSKLNDAINEVIKLHSQLQQQKAVDFEDSDSDREGPTGSEQSDKPTHLTPLKGSSPPSGSLPSQTMVRSQLQEDDDNVSVVSMQTMTVRFQEFVRLKRENKELKLQLADLNSSSRVVRSNSVPKLQMNQPQYSAKGGKSLSQVRLPKLRKN